MKRLILGLLAAAVLPLGSCVTDDVKGSSDGSGKLSVYMTASGMEVGLAKTRASLAPETGEDRIGSLYLLFFEQDAAGGGRFVDMVTVEGPLNMNTRFDINLAETSLDVIEAYNILAVANIDGTAGSRYLNGMSVDNWILQWAGRTEREVMAQATAWTIAGFGIEPSALLMNGRVEKGRNQFDIDLVLSRNQVRFDVLNDANEDYRLMEVQIHNAYPSSSLWNRGEIDYTNAVGRIPMYYGYVNPDPDSDILGHLYSFENHVPMPVQNDRFTTALLIRLQNRNTSTSGWYRINVVPSESAQILKRDNAYRLTIQNVGGPGFATAQQAYDDPNQPDLDYVINFWDQNNSGVIVQDGSSILSIPSKTVRIGREGGAPTFQIFSFTNSPNPVSPLAIVSQSYTPANNQISATLTGNTLTINASALSGAEVERRGTITLGFAGLQATIDVIQSSVVDDFIQVILPNNVNVPRFAPFAGLSSGQIRISASGDWTAEIFSEWPDAFSFADPAGGSLKKVISSADPADMAYITDGRFRIYTNTANHTAEVRDAFIVVSLDKDPENHAAVFRISQAPAGGISIVPNQTAVTFHGNGTGLAQIPNNTTTVFNVRPGEVDDGGGNLTIAQWEWKFRDSGTDTWEDTSAWFEVDDESHSTSDPAQNTITLAAKGQNLSGLQRTSTLRMRLVFDPATYVDLQVVQQPLSFSLQPNVVPAVAVTGGRTQNITVAADNTLSWSAAIATVGGTSSDGRQLVQHAARLFTQDGTEVNPTATYPTSTAFYVEFPKVYYPNRNIPISATVTVTVAGTLTQTINVTQAPLTSNGFTGFNIAGGTYDWGLLGNTYNQGWDAGLARIPGWRRLTPDGSFATTSVNASVTYLHVVPQRSGSAGTNWNWSAVRDFIENDRGWTVISQQANTTEAINNSYSPVKTAGYNDLVYGGGTSSGTFNSGFSATKLYQFVMDRGMTPITASQITSTFTTDGIRTSIPSPWPASAVVFISRTGSPDNAMLVMDIENGFMYIGESQMFWRNTNTDMSDNRGTFMNNLLQFIANASMYGSHFTDLLLENGRPGAQPAPWDEHWGANRASTPNGVPGW